MFKIIIAMIPVMVKFVIMVNVRREFANVIPDFKGQTVRNVKSDSLAIAVLN